MIRAWIAVISVLVLALGFCGWFISKWQEEKTLREEAIAGYEKIVEHWQQDATRLTTLNTELAMYRDSLNAMQKRISNNDLRLIAKEKPEAFIGIINSNTGELFAAIEATSRGGNPADAPTRR